MGLREKITAFGEDAADWLAKWGASWRFILAFNAFIIGWITWNTLHGHPFDPYPYILLNLFFSWLAANQAPVIMMSQRRAEAHQKNIDERDRQREIREAENQLASLEAQHAVLGDIRTMLKKLTPEDE